MPVHFSTRKKGSSMIETVVYVFVLTLLLGVVSAALFSLVSSYRLMRSERAIESGATASFERMVREIRDAKSVDTLNSVLNSSPGTLVLNTTDSTGAAT